MIFKTYENSLYYYLLMTTIRSFLFQLEDDFDDQEANHYSIINNIYIGNDERQISMRSQTLLNYNISFLFLKELLNKITNTFITWNCNN